jgi:hypothetical protein
MISLQTFNTTILIWPHISFFDDTDLGSDASMAIGEILLDEQEHH